MATNTLGGVNLTRIAQLSLDALTAAIIPLSAFTTDFSKDALPTGDVVTTRFATVPSTQDFSSSKATGNSVLTARSITLSNYRGVSIGFKDTELTFSDVKLSEQFVKPAVSAIIDYVVNAALEIVTNANFSQNTVVTAANFDADAVADLAQALSTAKVPANPRTLLVKPTYYASLVKDNAVQNAAAYASDSAIKENRVPVLHGFKVVEYNGTIPGNSENLEGIATHPQGICIAARGVVEPPAGTWYGKVQNIIEPTSGLPIQIREYYDGSELRYEWSVLFGVQKGVTGNLYRILSA